MSKVGLFLQRWSRLKTQPQAEPVSPTTAAPSAVPLDADQSPALPPVEDLTLQSDFSAFLQPGVDADTRRAAMKKLFMNEHYRSMDMLDVYVDDYSKPELLPAAMLTQLQHAVDLLAKPEQPSGQGADEAPVPIAQATENRAAVVQQAACEEACEEARGTLPSSVAPEAQDKT